ncbi:unnamed protein product [Caenorhabditis angaria]|uniref:EGF-like domain-containing protein n=1 Tax=Caenorhabditis angaria TaxID=860376 RepID=A0A9P1IZS6_9PELO|nr:unnamed protein product [Caenorhabditis angaria]
MITCRIFLLLLFYIFSDFVNGINSEGQIGQTCLLDGEKQCLPDNSQCIEGICMCSSFYKFINGSCVTEQSKTLGKHCRGGADCRGQGEFCSSFSICMCLSTHVDVGSQCKPVIYPGQFGCEDSLQCNKGFPGAECDVSRICVCPHGMFVNQQTCVSSEHPSSRNAIINELMLQNVIMADHRQVNRSEMKGNFFRRRNYDNSRSYQISPDATCSYDNQCAGYPLAICNNVCQCVKGALNTGTTCITSSAALQSSVSCPAGQTYVREAGVCMTVQQPGEPCQYSQQCSALEPGAYCLKMRCECVYGMKKSSNGCTFVNKDCKERGHIFISELGECREVIPPGGKGCSHNSQCSAAYPDATCFMQTCTCPPNLPVAADGTCGRACGDGFVYSGVTGECLPEVQPGGTCLYSSQCQSTYGGMVCDQNTCRCPNGLIFDGMKCSQTCPSYKRFTEKNQCVEMCSSGNIDVNGECLKKVAIGQACVASAQCTSGSFCQKGSCLCAPGFYVVNDQCQAVEAEPNTSCLNNEKCTKGSVCYNGRCTCPRNHELVNGYCQANRPVPIGSACVRVGVSCDGGSVCVAGICVCPLGKTPRNGFCIKHVTTLPGTSCADGEECIENSVCSEDRMVCECISQTQMVVGNRCVERLRSHPGYGCTMGEMCVGNSICNNGKCECAPGKVEINKVCVDQVNARIGETCGKGINCQGGSYCNLENGKCACPKGQREISGECKQVVLAYPGESCTEMTARCAGGSYCVRGRCECPFSMTLVDKKCVVQQTANPGEGCNENTACSGFSVCKDNTCTCVNEMVVRDKVCIQRRKVNIGSSCDKYDQCLGNSNCYEDICQCPTGHVVTGNMCTPRKTVTPGYLCNPEDICTGQSMCVKGVCQCKPGYKVMHNICVKNVIGLEGSVCSSREDCGETLQCENGLCSCPKGMFSVNGKCRSYISLGQTCTSDDRCSNSDAICFENLCTCRPGYAIINGQCKIPPPSAPIPTPTEPEVLAQMKAQRCVASNQCPSGANCVRGECKCKPGLGLSRLGFCIPINYADPGTSCAHGERCRGESQCIDGICVCNNPLLLKENKCVRSPRVKRYINTKSHRKLLKFTPKKQAKLGEYCFRDDQCGIQRPCLKNVCKCPKNYVQSGNSCVPRMSVIGTISLPGEACGFCIGGSSCQNGICKCADGYYKQQDSCVRSEAKIGAPCGLTTGCSSGSECISSYCQCREQYDADNDECYPPDVTQIKRAKSLGAKNSGARKLNRVVNANSVICPIGYDLVNGMCVNSESLSVIQLAEPGGPCEDGRVLCTGNSVCASNICICPGGELVQNGTCVSISSYANPGEACSLNNTVCTGNSFCIDGVCKCNANQGAINGVCSNMGNSLCGQSQCGMNQICVQDNCQCQNGYTFQQGTTNCVQVDTSSCGNCGSNQVCIQDQCQCQTGFNRYCNSNNQCSCVQCGSNQIFMQNQCQCQPGYYAPEGSCSATMSMICNCVQAQQSSGCVSNQQCGQNQLCVQNQCQCQQGYSKSSCTTEGCNCIANCIGNGCSVNTQPSGLPGQMCSETTQCQNNAMCMNNYCVCPSNRVLSGNSCVQYLGDASPGQSCQTAGIICRGGSSCYNNVCQCANGLSPQGGSCAPAMEVRFTIVPYIYTTAQNMFDLFPGQSCNPNCAFQPCLQRCSGGSTCSNSVCTCPQGSYVNNNACVNQISSDMGVYTRTSRPGDGCDNTIVCTGGSSCVIGTCSCDMGYTPSSDRTSCVLIDRVGLKSRSYPKSFCTFDKDCKDGAICIDKRCSCRIDQEMINGKCQPANQPGSRCHTDFCNNGAECQNGYCVCTKTHNANSTLHCVNEKTLAYPGSACRKNDRECQNGSTCLFGYCVYPSDDKDQELNPNPVDSKKACSSYKDCNHLETCSKSGFCECTFNTNLVNGEYPAPPVRRPSGLTECPLDGSCQLPNCFCTITGKTPPNDMEIKKVPQMIMLSFDDPITDRIINTLKSLFSGKIRNPNGCAIKGTFFISHQWNNYDQSQWLYSKGNEIGVNSITREDLSERTKERWLREQNGMRDTLAEFSYIEKSQIIGTRAPSYRLGGDLQFEMLSENNFTFDNSMLVNGLYWPQTLDHKLPWECEGKCPQRSYKNVWEIPIQNMQANDGNWYTTLSQALKPSDSRVSVKQMLMRNFLSNYKSNRAPFVLTLSTDFLTYLPDNGAIYALEDFFERGCAKR